MKYYLYFFISIFFCFFYLNLSQENSKNIPVLVQVVFRHGERVPVKSYPNDPYKNFNWGVPLGSLTKNGFKQQIRLGNELRKRYIENFQIVSPKYNPNEIQVRSTNKSRTILSAYANLKGFFNNTNIGNIPILTDFFGIPVPWNGGQTCLKYKEMITKKLNFYQEPFYKSNKKFIDNISKKAGFSKMSFLNVTYLYDTIHVQNRFNFSKPKWLTKNELFMLRYLTNEIYKFQNGLPSFGLPEDLELIKHNEGPLFRTILDNFDLKQKVNRKNIGVKRLENKFLSSNFSDSMRYVIFSAHDYTIANLFAIMSNKDFINNLELYFDFTATLFFELYLNNTNEYEIKILFSKKEGKNIIDITDKIRGCKGSKKCLYSDFKNSVSKRILANIKEDSQVVFRHGERAPLKTYQNDPYKNYDWGVPLGTLTETGVKQIERLGKNLRKRYVKIFKIVSSKYNKKEILVRSTNKNRTLESARAFLRGFYKLKGIPNIPILYDFFGIPVPYMGGVTCLKYKEMITQIKESYEETFYKNNKKFLDSLAKKTGFKRMYINNVTLVYDTIYIQNKLNLPRPKWLSRRQFRKLKHLTYQIYRLQDGVPCFDFPENVELMKVNEGPLLRTIMNNMEIKQEYRKNKKVDLKNKYLYSNFTGSMNFVTVAAHDYTLANLFSIIFKKKYLNSSVLHFQFAASLHFELYLNQKNKYEIKIVFSGNGGRKFVDITHKARGCFGSKICLFDDFKKAMDRRVLKDIQGECFNNLNFWKKE
uniref:2-phosphoxylose phosphatase 1 n=1 Tax=Strongyloides stercoralis TaxID=6248 RepID=A0AAF5D1X4_STRER